MPDVEQKIVSDPPTVRSRLSCLTLIVFFLFFVDFDGLFISNGPGDPQLCQTTIDNVRKVVCVENPKPVFGICLGHQLLSLVIGSKTYKMKLVPLTNTKLSPDQVKILLYGLITIYS